MRQRRLKYCAIKHFILAAALTFLFALFFMHILYIDFRSVASASASAAYIYSNDNVSGLNAGTFGIYGTCVNAFARHNGTVVGNCRPICPLKYA